MSFAFDLKVCPFYRLYSNFNREQECVRRVWFLVSLKSWVSEVPVFLQDAVDSCISFHMYEYVIICFPELIALYARCHMSFVTLLPSNLTNDFPLQLWLYIAQNRLKEPYYAFLHTFECEKLAQIFLMQVSTVFVNCLDYTPFDYVRS